MTTAIEAIETMPLIPIESIRVDGGTQARAGLDEATLAEYADAYEDLARQQNGLSQMPPIVLFHDGSTYWLADGFHRLAAYKRFLDRSITAAPKALAADVRQGTRRDAVLYAAGANAEHGLRRTNADKRRAIEALLRDEEWRQWSDSEIGRRCKVDHKTVAKIREELYPGISQDARTVERNGTTYQMTPATKLQKPNIPEQSAPAASEPFWQSLSATHPTAHLWAEIRPGYWKAACGITTRRALSGSTDAEHCSSCMRATWEKETPKPAAQSYHARDLVCSGCGSQWGAAGSLVNASGRYCPACVAAGEARKLRTCTRCGQVSADLTSYQAGLVAEYPDRAVSLCPRCVPAILKERSERPKCEDCGAVATGRANIGGVRAWRCEACKRAAEQAVAEQEGTDDWIGMTEVGMATIRAAWQREDRAAAVHAALALASAIAPDDLAELADQLDDADYEALACYRRDRSGSMLEKEAI